MAAVHAGSYRIVQQLIKAGAEPNIVVDGYTALSAAKQMNDSDMARLLKKYGAKE